MCHDSSFNFNGVHGFVPFAIRLEAIVFICVHGFALAKEDSAQLCQASLVPRLALHARAHAAAPERTLPRCSQAKRHVLGRVQRGVLCIGSLMIRGNLAPWPIPKSNFPEILQTKTIMRSI